MAGPLSSPSAARACSIASARFLSQYLWEASFHLCLLRSGSTNGMALQLQMLQFGYLLRKELSPPLNFKMSLPFAHALLFFIVVQYL